MKKLLVILALVISSGCKPSPKPPIVIPPTEPPVIPPIVQLSRPVSNGTYFKLENESRITFIGVTDFALFKLYLDGVDIDPILLDRNGANLHRVFLSCKNLFDLDPANYPDFYLKLVPFANRLAKYNRYVELVVFADAPSVFPTIASQMVHYDKVIDAVKDQTNVLIELVNENSQPANTINTALFAQPPAPVVSSHGSNSSEEVPVRIWWNYETFHTNGSFEWWRKGGHNGMELSAGAESLVGSGVAVIADENTRYIDNDNSLSHSRDSAAAAALLIGGSTYHCDGCRWSRLFTVAERIAFDQWVEGANSVPLFCQDGVYHRRDDLLTPFLLRVYQRGLDDSCIVKIRK